MDSFVANSQSLIERHSNTTRNSAKITFFVNSTLTSAIDTISRKQKYELNRASQITNVSLAGVADLVNKIIASIGNQQETAQLLLNNSITLRMSV